MIKAAKTTRPHGFTLTELLVVIVVLGVLIALGVPIVFSAIEKTNISKSLANLRQLGAAMNLYADENNERYPYTQSSSGEFWSDVIDEYLGYSNTAEMRDLLVCPIADKNRTVAGSATYSPTTYTAPSELLGNVNNGTGIVRTRVRRPSKMILLATGPQVLANGGTTATFWWPWQGFQRQDMDGLAPINERFGGLDYRLNDSLGAVMVDGHAELIKRGSLTWANVLPTALDR
ncbi:MAG: prepilin-type N-terminal cleavage/methylation domain-containing protein [Verrucomicrobiota bacterium]